MSFGGIVRVLLKQLVPGTATHHGENDTGRGVQTLRPPSHPQPPVPRTPLRLTANIITDALGRKAY